MQRDAAQDLHIEMSQLQCPLQSLSFWDKSANEKLPMIGSFTYIQHC